MLQRILNSKTFVAYLLAAATGTILYFVLPFPRENVWLTTIRLRAPTTYAAIFYAYQLFLFTTPYIAFSVVLSGLYIFASRRDSKVGGRILPPYPPVAARKTLFLVVGEIHNPREPVPAANPQWLIIPERGLFTGIAIIGAVGTGKTSCCMYPFADQLIGYRAADPERKMGGLVLEVKGDFCHKVREILQRHDRADDYIEVNLHSEYRYNPLHNDLDGYALAYSIASLLNNLFGKGKEPFWQQAYTNLVKFIIILHKVAYDYVTLFDVYECAINPDLLESRIQEAEHLVEGETYVLVSYETFGDCKELWTFGFLQDPDTGMHRAPQSKPLLAVLERHAISWESQQISSPEETNQRKKEQLEAVKRWFYQDWRRIEPKLRTSIVEGISVFLSLFDDNPDVKRTFCPPQECYDPVLNSDHRYGKVLPSFSWLIEHGAVCALNFPVGLNPGLARAIGVMMKLDFQRAVLNRIPEMAKNRERYFRQVFFICDEYQNFATVGENEPTGDEKFFSLSREPKCIPIVATQSISSLKSTLPGETWRTLLQTFRTKIFLALSDDFSARTASELCGREDQLKVSYNISESGHDANVSYLTGKTLAHKANITTSKSYSTHSDFRFDMKTFTELQNAHSVTIAYDGINPLPPMFCYLKPYYNDVNKPYFQQLADGEL